MRIGETTERFSLTPLQKGMLFHHLLASNSGVDIEQMTIEIPEAVDAEWLARAWNQVIAHHEVLRAGFESRGGHDHCHVVADTAAVTIERLDFTAMSTAEADAATASFLTADRQRGFDLARPPLMRLTLAALGPERHRLFWTFHHILIDGRSFVIILDQVWRVYESIALDQPVVLAPSGSYRDYVAWLDTVDLSGAEAFWKERLAGLDMPTPLPADPDRPTQPRGAPYGEVEIRLSAEVNERLAAFAREERVTMNTMLQGAWAILLARHTGRDDVLFAATKTTRSSSIPGAGDIVGLFLVTVPVRVRVPDDALVGEWLRGVRTDWLALRAYEQVPLAEIARWAPFRPTTRLLDSLVLYESSQFEEDVKALGPRWARRDVKLREQTNFGLSLLGYGGITLRLKLEFDSRRYTEGTARRLLASVETLLLALEAGRGRRLGEVAALTATEREQVLYTWNATAREHASILVPDQVRRQATRTPDAIAVRFEDERVTYRELDRRVNALAYHLRTLGIGPSVLVGIGMNRSIEMVVALLAVLRAGGAYVPLDPAFPAERIQFMVEDSGLGVVLTTRVTGNVLGAAKVTRIFIEDHLEGREVVPAPEAIARPDDLAYVLYTSGSTGRPKGVQIEHRNLINFLASMAREPGIDAADVLLSVTTLSFDIAGLEIMLPLVTGAQLVIVPRDVAVDGRELKVAIEKVRPTIMQATPATWRMLIASGLGPQREMKILCGGEALPPELAAGLLERCGELWNVYGPTETTIWSTVKRVRDADAITIGRPIDNTTLYIVDRGGRPVPIGATGELLIGGLGVARGYLGREELTAEKFIPDPFVTGARVYRTGDLARHRSDGEVECLGRSDHQVKIRGFRIELGEIEAVLERHPDLRQAVVDKRDEALVAWVVPNDLDAYADAKDRSQLAADLHAFLGGKLPPYMAPADFVVVSAVPMTPNNKVDRKALPTPQSTSSPAAGERTPPRTDEERRMAAIWERVLERSAISVIDTFFDLGGDSLRAVSLLIAVEDEFGVRLPLSSIMEAPTVEQLVRMLSDSRPAGIVTRLRDGSSDRAPLWCIPGAAGHVVAFRHLVARLPRDHAVFGLETLPGEDGGGSVGRIAEAYLGAIRERQERGPYILLGLCFGALVAYEIARQLERAGERVEILGMLDPSVPRAFFTPATVARIALQHLGTLARLSPGELLSRVRRLGASTCTMALARIKRYVKRDAAAKPAAAVEVDRHAAEVAEHDRVRDARIEVGTQYVPGRYQGSVFLFIAEERGITGRVSTEGGWRRRIGGAVDVKVVPGTHSDFFLEPHVDHLADLIQQELRRLWAARPARDQ